MRPEKTAFPVVAALALLLSAAHPGLAQQTTCFASLQHSDGTLNQLFGDDPDTVIGGIRAQLAASQLPQGHSRAHLYAMLADAYYVKGDDNAAREAAVAGLAAITPADAESLRRRLNLVGIYLLGETGQLGKAAREFEAAAQLVPLVAAGYRVTTAEDGDQARELLVAGTVADLLLSDIRMPGSMNGLQLAAWVREHRPAMAIILQTGFSELGTSEFTVLRKPYSPDELFAAIDSKVRPAI